mmetsp:Transcript_29376/g.68123  ORF Transcript_29376/g.68123 Transcript_29376/m.68123 type:complete len:502 (-) Transcript_29376:55-1560(-)
MGFAGVPSLSLVTTVVLLGAVLTAAVNTVSLKQLFDPSASSTYHGYPERSFFLKFGDRSQMRGFTALEYVQLGDYRALSPIGIITDGSGFEGADGILGMGCRKEEHAHHVFEPLLWAMTDPKNPHSNARQLQRQFSFFSTDDAAELQLGGYDPAALDGEMTFMHSLSGEAFVVPVTSLTFGATESTATEILVFQGTPTHLPSLLDSGASCLVLPGTTLGGQLAASPWDTFSKAWDHADAGYAFWITISGKKFKIPFDKWFLSQSKRTCVEKGESDAKGIVIGDVFFRSHIVLFDMIQEYQPQIGIGRRNEYYTTTPVSYVNTVMMQDRPPIARVPVARRARRTVLASAPKTDPANAEAMNIASETQEKFGLDTVDHVPVDNDKDTLYVVELQVGTPPQPFSAIVDTGSSVMAVFVKPGRTLLNSKTVVEPAATEDLAMRFAAGLSTASTTSPTSTSPSTLASSVTIAAVCACAVIVLGLLVLRGRRRTHPPLSSLADSVRK